MSSTSRRWQALIRLRSITLDERIIKSADEKRERRAAKLRRDVAATEAGRRRREKP